MLRIRIFFLLVLVHFALLTDVVPAVTPIKHPDPNTSLNERWKWALQQLKQNGTWIGYSIEQQMPENEIIGSFYTNQKKYPTIYGVLTGKERPFNPKIRTQGDVQIISREGITVMESKDSGPGRIISREVGILFGYTGSKLTEVDISLLDLQFNFKGRDLIWLGTAEHQESISLLNSAYQKETRSDIAEDLLSAIGVHRSPSLVIPILKQVLYGNAKDPIRASAAFWLGQQNHPEALKVLSAKLESEKSEDVIEDALCAISEMTLPEADHQLKQWTKQGYSRLLREGAIFWIGQKESQGTLKLLEEIAMNDTDHNIIEKAIFSMSEMEKTSGVTETLIRIARNHKSREGRKEAIFWLSQNYSEKIAKTISEFALKDPDREVQKHAIFALSELENGEGVTELIQIAKSHKDPEVRKQAIFWLGECDDSRAHEALLQIIESD